MNEYGKQVKKTMDTYMNNPDSIDKEISDIQNATHGVEVRGALAAGVKKSFDKSTEAETTSNSAQEQVGNIQNQVDQLVIEGDSSVEAAQARVDADGKTYNTLKERLDEKETEFSSQLAHIDNLENYELNSKARRKRGLVVFISDDAHRGDWEILKPMFESEGVPFCTAVVTDWMIDPSQPNHSTRMTWEQLEYLQNEMGCEIMSHSKTHGRPTLIPDQDITGLRTEYSESINELKSRGFDVFSYRVPGGNFRTRERVIAKEYYRSMVVSDYGVDGLNHTPFEQYELKSIWLDNESFGGAKDLSYYQDHINRAVEEDALLIISTHGYALSGVEDLFLQVLQYAKNNSQVVTLNEALNTMGNIVDVGDFSKVSTGDREGGKHYVVGADGTVSGGLNVAELNEYDNLSKWDEFPLGITLCSITSWNSDGFPASTGTLFNYKTRIPQFGFNYQEFREFRRNRIFYRYVDENGEFSDWELDNRSVMYDDTPTARTTISGFRTGITYTRMRSTHDYIDEMPEGAGGLLITHRMAVNEPWSFHYQEYHLNFSSSLAIYKRRCLGLNEWSDWVKVSI